MEFSFDAFTLTVVVITIVISLSIHEFMHAFVGLKLGDTTAHEEGRVSLNPLRHIDPFATVLLPIATYILLQAPILAAKPVPFNPDRVKYDEFGAALIAAAGPLSNFVLAVVGAIMLQFSGANETLFNALTIFTALNIGIFVFNLVPIPPLDGSRILYAFAPEPLQRFMEQIEPFGIFIVFGLVFMTSLGALLVNINTDIFYWLINLI